MDESDGNREINDDMKNMLYVCGINWKWIFQRPQILALQLQENYNVTVMYPKKIIKFWKDQKESPNPKCSKPILQFPLQNKVKILRLLSQIGYYRAFRKVSEYDIVWFGYPVYFKYLPQNYKGKVVYDCMDWHSTMIQDKQQKSEIINLEKQLCDRADIIIVSSNKLKDYITKLLLKKNKQDKVVLVRNGITDSKCYEIKKAVVRQKNTLCYVGTIEKWLDFSILEKSVSRIDNIEYHLLGPCMIDIPVSKKICYDGVVEHNHLYETIKEYDCLIMPFKLNDTIEAVDPVKLYEYISWGKCIISIYYPEIDRFKDYVYFYHDESEYIALVQKLVKEGFPPKYNEKQQREFIKNNTWKNRNDEIQTILNNKL